MRWTVLLLGVGLLAGCFALPSSWEASTPGAAVRTDPELCAEHGVLEAVCTQCSPKLAPVFQARGDWCPEHGFPESFCPICSPEAGGRPVTGDVTADGAPADGTLIRFRTLDAARLTGIETVPAEATPWSDGVQAVARLDWDATRVAAVSAPTAGIVTRVAADVGTPVQAGAPLATLRSAGAGSDRARLAAAREAVTTAQADLDRATDLLAAGVTSEAQVQAARSALAAARAEVRALRAEAGLVGDGTGSTVTLTAPLEGVVIAREVTVGEAVTPDRPVYTVVDPSRLWARLDIAETDLGQVQVGQTVRVQVDALPGRTFEGRLAYLAPMVDPHTRTAEGRVALDNPDGALRAHLHGEAVVVTDTVDVVVSVPGAAVQRARGASLVFLREAPDRYITRRVEVLGRQGDRARIRGGVAPGDPVVTTGAFLLMTETLKDSIGAGCCDVEPR